MSDVDVPEGWISVRGRPSVYHTDRSCSQFPEVAREVSEVDVRRNVRECSECMGFEVAVLDGD